MALTLPLTTLYFGRVSLVTIPVNLLIVPVQSVILIGGGLALLISFAIPLIGQALLWGVMLFLSWTIAVVRTFAALPFAGVDALVPARAVTVLYLLVLGWFLMEAVRPDFWSRFKQFVGSRKVAVGAAASLTVAAVLVWLAVIARPDGRFHLYFLDMGSSNTVLMQTPDGAQILIDGGRYPSRLLTALGDRLPYYDREIEMLIITQPDWWDIGALPELFERYGVRQVLTNGQPNLSTGYQALLHALTASGAAPIYAGATVTTDDGVTIAVLNPSGPPELGDWFGETSLVLHVQYGDFAALLPADAGGETLRMIVERGDDLRSTLLQLPDHGTQRAMDAGFLAAVDPEAAVLQVDPANLRGDPDVDVLTLLGDLPLWRTDVHGALHIWTDGVTWHIEGQG
jgi:competence protein ComEC